MDTKTKSDIIKKYAKTENDTGSTEVQVAVMTAKIKELTEHMRANKKDHSSRRGLIRLVNQRRKLLKYLSKEDFERYQSLSKELGIRIR